MGGKSRVSPDKTSAQTLLYMNYGYLGEQGGRGAVDGIDGGMGGGRLGCGEGGQRLETGEEGGESGQLVRAGEGRGGGCCGDGCLENKYIME